MKNLTKILIGLLIVITFVMLLALCGRLDTTYTRHGYIDSIEESNILIIVDTTGNEWEYQLEGYEVGDRVAMKMFNNHTDNIIIDDEIESLRKE